MALNWERARSEEQIEYRVEEIVGATARLYESNPFDEITFASIAKEAGFTRSNLYRYFDTKEEVFLEFIKHDLAAWREEVFKTFQEGAGSASEFSETWEGLLLKHRRLIKLATILNTTLEPNSSLEDLTSFKRNFLEELALLTEFLSKLPMFQSVESAGEFLYAQMSLAVGMYPMLDPTPNQKTAMDAVGMVSDPQYFRRILINSTTSLLSGLAVSSDN